MQTLLCDFPPEQAANDGGFFTRVALFDYLELQEQEAILTKRLAHGEAGMSYFHHLMQMGEETCTIAEAQQRVLAFHLQQVRHEQHWIRTWLEEIRARTEWIGNSL